MIYILFFLTYQQDWYHPWPLILVTVGSCYHIHSHNSHLFLEKVPVGTKTTSMTKSRRAVVSCKAKKKQQARAYSGQCDHYSELFTWMVERSSKHVHIQANATTTMSYLHGWFVQIYAIAQLLLQLSLSLLQTHHFLLLRTNS